MAQDITKRGVAGRAKGVVKGSRGYSVLYLKARSAGWCVALFRVMIGRYEDEGRAMTETLRSKCRTPSFHLIRFIPEPRLGSEKGEKRLDSFV